MPCALLWVSSFLRTLLSAWEDDLPHPPQTHLNILSCSVAFSWKLATYLLSVRARHLRLRVGGFSICFWTVTAFWGCPGNQLPECVS